jgi:uncharacterized protein YjiS (DUF1127 family)
MTRRRAVNEIRTTGVGCGSTRSEDAAALRRVEAAVSARDPFAGSLKLVTSLVDSLSRWRERARGRRLLMEMDERLLKDIGISRSDAYRESRKPFWRA